MTNDLLPNGKGWDFIEENYTSITQRYSGFGSQLFTHLNAHFPNILLHFRFFRSLNFQEKDVFAIYQSQSVSFAIQLDPDIEVIVLWDKTNSIEIGAWSEDEYKEAIDFIEANFIKQQNLTDYFIKNPQ